MAVKYFPTNLMFELNPISISNDRMKIFFYLAITFVFLTSNINAQETDEPLTPIFIEQIEHAADWIPTLLNASNSSLYNSIIFNGRIVGWYLRGDNNASSVLDGIQYASPLNKWRFWDLLAGMQGQIRRTNLSVNGVFTDEGYFQNSNVSFLSSSVQDGNKNINIGTAVSNSMYANSLSIRMNTPNLINHWRSSFGLVLQHMPTQIKTASYKESIGLIYGLEKQLSKKNNVGFTFFWNYSDQSKVSTAVKEVFDLTHQNTYNPTWGWRNLQPYFPNTKQSNAPIISFRYQHTINENNYYKLNQSIIIGRQSASSLEWTQTADPRPDYYRYLPSYFAEGSLKNDLKNWYLIHPESLQINFDKIDQINKASKDQRSYYIVNQQNSDLFLWNGSFLSTKYYGNELNVSWGANYLYHQIGYSNEVKDLLGGNYFLNYNNWVNDDGLNTSFQNDIQHPDRKITHNEIWGPNYTMYTAQLYPWLQVNKNYAKFETIFGMGLGVQVINRDGHNMNGLFPTSSFGKSNYFWSDAKDFKLQVLYKFSGRIYFRSIIFAQWKLPSVENLFIDPAFNSITSPFVKSIYKNGVDLSIFYRTPNLKLYFSAYWNNSNHHSISRMFYHDEYASFVYGLAGNINKVYSGFEFSAEMPIFQNLQLIFVATLQKNIFSNKAPYQLLSINDLQPFAKGQLHLEGLAAESSPSLTNVLTLQYQPISTFKIGVTMLFAKQRPIAIDYFRRTEAVKNKLDPYSWNKLQQASFLPDNTVVNVFISKSIQLKIASKTIRGFTSLSIRNVLNTFVPIFAYEQSRFDYIKFNANKYATKYLLDQGVTYSFRIQIQIQ